MKKAFKFNHRQFYATAVFLSMSMFFGCQVDETELETEQDDISLKSSYVVPSSGELPYGAKYEIALPMVLDPEFSTKQDYWNSLDEKVLIVYAHGMVNPGGDPEIPNDFIGDYTIEQFVTGNGYAYATTSYRENGLVVLDAIEDIKNLKDTIDKYFVSNDLDLPDYVLIGGVSEGGLIESLSIEAYPDLFNGAISICGPIGNFYKQLLYNGNFHVLFNYFFADKLPDYDFGDPEGVGDEIREKWEDDTYNEYGYNAIQQEIVNMLMQEENYTKALELIACANVTADISDPKAVAGAIIDLLRFNIMLTNNVNDKLDGIVFNNRFKWYTGSSNDFLLNRTVQRIQGDISASDLKELGYETTGNISIPVVTMQTLDHVCPVFHNPLYRLKVMLQGNSLLYNGFTVNNYGHVTIDETHITAALAIVLTKCRAINAFDTSTSTMKIPDLELFKEILQEQSIDVITP